MLCKGEKKRVVARRTFDCNLEIGLGPLDVDEGAKYDGKGDFCAAQEGCCEVVHESPLVVYGGIGPGE